MNWHNLWNERETGRLRCWWRVLAFFVIGALAALILAVFLIMPAEVLVQNPAQLASLPGFLYLILFFVAVIFAAVAAGIWALKVFEHLPAHTLGLAARGPWRGSLLLGFGTGLALTGVLAVALWLSGAATLTVRHLDRDDWTAFVFVSLAVLLGAAAVEVVLHGYLFQTLLRGAGPLAALLISGGLALLLPAHESLFSLIGPANLLVLCLVFGMLYLRAGSLWPSIGLAAGWTYGLYLLHLPLVCISLPPVETPFRLLLAPASWLNDPVFGPCGGVVTSVLLLAVLAVLAYTRRGLPLESQWWEWRQIAPALDQALSWDFSIGDRYYQWKLLARDHADS